MLSAISLFPMFRNAPAILPARSEAPFFVSTFNNINKIALDLREAHKDDFFSVPEDSPLEDFLQAAEETAKEDSDPEQAAMMFICKRLKLNYKKLSEEEKKWLKKIAQKSDLLKNPKPQRGRK